VCFNAHKSDSIAFPVKIEKMQDLGAKMGENKNFRFEGKYWRKRKAASMYVRMRKIPIQ